MQFALIICTYLRPQTLLNLLESLDTQTLYPHEVLIIDGSENDETELALMQNAFKNLSYYKVDETLLGLTKQRNFGVSMVSPNMDVICFLDDDIVLKENYFEMLIATYQTHKDALAVGGYICNEVVWKKQDGLNNNKKFYYDGWMRNEPLRFRVRKLCNLLPDTKPCFLPSFSHGRSVSFLPPSGKIYEVEQIMGGASSYRKEIFKKLKFSNYFEGYGLYEDTDFSLRIAKFGKLYVNTMAQLYHYHEASGRPNKFKYGKMVLRNGWYVWRIKYLNPNFKSIFKWHATALLLTALTFLSVFSSNNKKEQITDGLGRVAGWFSLMYNKPNIKR